MHLTNLAHSQAQTGPSWAVAADATLHGDSGSGAAPRPKTQEEASLIRLPPGWECCLTPEGIPYFVVRAGGKSGLDSARVPLVLLSGVHVRGFRMSGSKRFLLLFHPGEAQAQDKGP